MANQAWQITSPSVLSLNTLSDSVPSPGPKQALVRIHAVSINFRDILVLDHSPAYPLAHKENLIACSDAAGVVEQAGPDSEWKKGDRVIILPNNWLDGDNRNYTFEKTLGGGHTDGVLGRFTMKDDVRLVGAPENLSLNEAATLFTAGLTAFRAMFFNKTAAAPGVNIVTQGTGGVSVFAIQFAAAAGATVIATSSSDEKLRIAKKLGASHLINYRKTPEWAAEVLKLTDGKGVDHVFDVGGAGTIEQSLQATRQAGSVTVVGVLTETKPSDLIPALLFGDKTINGNLGAGNKVMFLDLIKFVAKHDIHPVIAKVFKFEEAKEAFEYMRHLSEVGKVVIEV